MKYINKMTFNFW